jgi:hypothetical protein
MLVIRTLRRVSSVLSLTRRLAHTAANAIVVLVGLAIALIVVQDAVHAIIPLSVAELIVEAKARTAAGTSSRAFVVPRQSIAARKLAAAFGTYVRALAGVQFRMTLQVM